jgi:hypothetical protein
MDILSWSFGVLTWMRNQPPGFSEVAASTKYPFPLGYIFILLSANRAEGDFLLPEGDRNPSNFRRIVRLTPERGL